MGARCCGEGQRLESGACTGVPRRCARSQAVTPSGCVAIDRVVRIAGGTLVAARADWEARGAPPRTAFVAPFRLDAHEVTEHRFSACVRAGACDAIALRGEPGLPVTNVTFAQAARFCAFAGGALPTVDQLAAAAAGPAARRYPWGDTGAVCRRAAFGLVEGPCAQGGDRPDLAGSRPDGATPDGVFDLAGNAAEWALRPRDALEAPASAPSEPSAPSVAIASVASVHGGSFRDATAAALRAFSRKDLPPDRAAPDIGFRCAYPEDR